MKAFASMIIACGIAVSAYPQQALYPSSFPLGDVQLLDSRFSKAQALNVDVLLKYDVDRLLAPYLKEAGVTPKAESFPCWDGLDGHVGGHYLTALAIHYASTGDPRLKERMDYMISELKRCQDASGNGYVGGVPDGKPLWDGLKSGNVGLVWKYWVPWYNVHKTYAGLRDAWLYAGDTQAKDMFLKFCDWGLDIIAPLSDEQMEAMLDQEFGGMPEVFADAYAITGDRKYLDGARRFSHHWLLDSMAAGVDNLDNKHANTQVPKVVGYERIAEVADDSLYRDASVFFWETVTGTRSLSIGGNSRREHFAPKDDCKSYVTDREGPESCNTNNMLKLSEGLFRMSRDARYADFYERALYNHILSTQHPVHGGYVYFTPARPAHYRVYSQPNSGMWCCVGTGMENHGKYGEFIYSHFGDSLYVNLFIPSRLDWKEKGVTVTQTGDFPADDSVSFTVDVRKPARFTLMLRHPGWCDDMQLTVNGKPVSVTSAPQSYLAIDRKWKRGDRVDLKLPMKVSVEEVPNVPDYISVVYGPVVLAARYSTEGLDGLVADDSRWAHIAHGPLVSVFDTPVLIGSHEEIVDALKSMEPMEGKPLHFRVPRLLKGKYASMELEPFADIHDARYMLYWLSMTQDRYDNYLKMEKAAEAMSLDLDRRTIDVVKPGEQQPEADHFMANEQSKTGYLNDVAWRDASDGGFFSYRMKPAGEKGALLLVKYWGNEPEGRQVEIYIEGELIASENLSGKWGIDEFVTESYALPEWVTANDAVTVTFQSVERGNTGGIYDVRIVKP